MNRMNTLRYALALAVLAWPLLAMAGGATCPASSAPSADKAPAAAAAEWAGPQSGPGEPQVVELAGFSTIGLGVDAPGFDP
jgi:hypothetical protein